MVAVTWGMGPSGVKFSITTDVAAPGAAAAELVLLVLVLAT